MAKAIIGKKLGMTSIFQDGTMIPVTVIEAGPCMITQVKNKENDGYNGVQVGFLPKKEKHTTKQLAGHFKKGNISPLKILREIPVEGEIEVGSEIRVGIFTTGDYVDVIGKSKGKGFAGVIKRHGFHRGPESHGSRHHRNVGSLGSMAAAHVFKGKKMPGRMGSCRITVQNLVIAEVLPEQNLILIKGAIPGAKKSIVTVRSAKKK